MQTSIFRYLVPLTIILAIIGLFTILINNPASLIRTLFFAGVVIAAVYIVYKWFFGKNAGSHYSKYQRAAKQSVKRQKKQARYKSPSHLKVIKSGKFKTTKLSNDSKKKARHLTVIDGKKNKKKNRALF